MKLPGELNPPSPGVLDYDTEVLVPIADHDQLDVDKFERGAGEPDDQEFVILSIRLTDGRTALLAFTSEDELREWMPEGGPFIAVRAIDAARMAFEWGHDVLYVNAYNPDGDVFVIRPEDLPADERLHDAPNP